MENDKSCFDCKHKEVKPNEAPCNKCINLNNSEYSQWEEMKEEVKDERGDSKAMSKVRKII